MKKGLIYIIILLILATFIYAAPPNKFTTGNVSTNLTFSEAGNITRFIDFPISLFYTDAQFSLEGGIFLPDEDVINITPLYRWTFEPVDNTTEAHTNINGTIHYANFTTTGYLSDGAVFFDSDDTGGNERGFNTSLWLFHEKNWTLSFWINITVCDFQDFFYQGDSDGTVNLIRIGMRSVPNCELRTYRQSNVGDEFGNGVTPLGAKGAWVHIVISQEETGAARYTRQYINGSFDAQFTQGINTGKNETWIGAPSHSGITAPLKNSTFDDVRYYNRTLNATEIATLYSLGYPSRFQIEVGDTNEVREYTSDILSTKINASINNTNINQIISDGCNCRNCSYISNNCRIPITFISNTSGIITVSDFYFPALVEAVLINELNNSPFDINNITGVKLFYDDNSSVWDFQTENSPYVNISTVTNKLRFEFEYPDGAIITRYVDSDLLNETLRVCVNSEGVTHYEQLIISALVKPVVMINDYSNCIIVADYTRFFYQDAYLLKAYTIDAPYSFYTEDNNSRTYLAAIDGTTQSYINVDTLEFNREGYDFTILQDALSIRKSGTTTLEIYYLNLEQNNDAIEAEIINTEDNSVIFSSTEFPNPNEFTIYFDYSVISNLTNSTNFKVNIEKTVSGETSTVSRYFNPQGRTGFLQAGFALTIAILLTIFGLTFSISRVTFSYLGIIIELAAIVVLSLSVPAWYITFLIAINVIILVYIVINLFTQNIPTISS